MNDHAEMLRDGIATPPRGRTTPSGAVTWAWEQLKGHGRFKRIVDIGCGRGRNTLFLARKGLHVTAMDLAPNAIEALQKTAAKQRLDGNIRAIVHDVTEDWPIETHETDLAIDMFCFRHLPTEEACKTYKENLLRILSVWGHYLIAFSSIGDGYYGRYLSSGGASVMPVDEAVRVDPSCVESPFYSRKKLVAFMHPELEVCGELKGKKKGGIELPETYALLFRRAPKWFYS